MVSANRGKEKAVAQFDEQTRSEVWSSKNVIVISDDEDDGGNEGPSCLRIEEQARNGVVFIDLSPPSTPKPESVLDRYGDGDEKPSDAKKKRKIGKENDNSISQEATASEAGLVDEEKVRGVTADELNRIEEPHAAHPTGNIILQKLLRGPRYFDPPNSGCLSCYNCGEEGHMAVNCTLAKRKKPCFVCGSMEHNSRACPEGKNCFVYKKGGYRAKDYPNKYNSATRSVKICLKCGDFGHDMFTCSNDYSLNDLKGIQCYVCKNSGHLCCAKFGDTNLGEISCYQCGRLGHSGLSCSRLGVESPGAGSLNSCYKCGEEGHLARECMKTGKRSGKKAIVAESSCYNCGEKGHRARRCKKAGKGNLHLPTSTQKYPKMAKGHIGFGSVPPLHIGKLVKKKNQYNGNVITASHKLKHRGDWATQGWNSPALPYTRSINSGWNYPATPNDRGVGIYPAFTPPLPIMASQNFVTQTPQGQHRFSALRFGNSSNPGMWGNYGGWGR